MLGPILLIFVLLMLIPAFLIGGGVLMAFVGSLLKKTAEEANPSSELIELNV